MVRIQYLDIVVVIERCRRACDQILEYGHPHTHVARMDNGDAFGAGSQRRSLIGTQARRSDDHGHTLCRRSGDVGFGGRREREVDGHLRVPQTGVGIVRQCDSVRRQTADLARIPSKGRVRGLGDGARETHAFHARKATDHRPAHTA